jgi:phosphatidate phosphatase PAH1
MRAIWSGFSLSLALGLALSACVVDDDNGDKQDQLDPVEMARCINRPFTPLAKKSFRHTTSNLVSKISDPHHGAYDVISNDGKNPVLAGRFVYGKVLKDLQDEDVTVFLDDCSNWKNLGTFRTNDDGEFAITVQSAGMAPGVYEARFQVMGDQSLATSYIWVMPKGVQLVVADIDGTLTTSDRELWEQILLGRVPESYPGAMDLTQAHSDLGWPVLYLTGRPYWLAERTRSWLAQHGYAFGPLVVTRKITEGLPLEISVGEFKDKVLANLKGKGFGLDYAYGNATTDITAYIDASIPLSDIWTIGKHAGEKGTQSAVDTWMPRVTEVEGLAPIEQPILWP